MRTTFRAAALLIAAFSIPQLANAGIIWDLTGTGKALAESKLRGKGAEESHLTNWNNGPSSNESNNNQNNSDNQNNNGNHYAYGHDDSNGKNDDKNDNNNNETVVVVEDYITEPVVPVETVTEPVSVPEPMSLVLFATGLLAVAAIARRKSGV